MKEQFKTKCASPQHNDRLTKHGVPLKLGDKVLFQGHHGIIAVDDNTHSNPFRVVFDAGDGEELSGYTPGSRLDLVESAAYTRYIEPPQVGDRVMVLGKEGILISIDSDVRAVSRYRVALTQENACYWYSLGQITVTARANYKEVTSA